MSVVKGPLFEELNLEAEAQGCRVHLEHAGEGGEARLSRIAVVDRDGEELAGLRIGSRGTERTSHALLLFMRARRETATS